MELVETKKTFYIEYLDIDGGDWYRATLIGGYLEFDNMEDAVSCIFKLMTTPGYEKHYRVNETTEAIHTL